MTWSIQQVMGVMGLWVCTKWGGDDCGKGQVLMCVFFWKLLFFRETVLPNSALLMSLSLEVCSTNTVLQRQDISGSEGRGTVMDLV